ncbi:hypothetical protein CJD36_016445 [Flavipsychrobacter stenotrophus]|uniref:Uncharacterized protein n=1 Tax=Flavipsychrobacter stenotrophus TaxID=2077091 RepID=A0A2S7STQ5_9BACT|nr:DUF6526 family protein [Flavipsychrobacter stenotrophus]PQJ10273.1 hypothetical protein CJD36_016445 [Flavipsychrobacter stenotrophus]
MKKQEYSNHIQWYVPQHFIFYPVVLAASIYSGRRAFTHPEVQMEWLAITGIFLLLAWLSFMMRQHYGLINQNRTVRLELRLRYFILTQQRLEPIEQQLSFGQLSALRFASDEELPALVQRAVAEKLSPTDIKKAIKNWEGDYMRV